MIEIMSRTTTATSLTGDFAETQWQQVLERDASADGQFFYGVKSTGIVCKPSCPSRRPTRENVRFFPTLTDAFEAGFRACRRCNPDSTAPRPDPHGRVIARVAKYLGDHPGQRVTTEALAKAAGVNRLTLLRAFRRVFGVSPAQYARTLRLNTFKEKVKEPKMRVTDAIYDAGFGSSSRLYENSSARLGMTPREMRNGAAGIIVRYSTSNSPLGRMLVAATNKGICTIAFGDGDAEVKAILQDRFPNAKLVAEEAKSGWLADAVAFVTNQMSEHPVAATFPLDVRATAFQQRVWKALQEIPRGETRTYSGLAADLGAPSSTRAVAGACAANPVAVVVPCHRVVGKSGSLTGYRWGVERKRKLLEAEKKSTRIA
jgi:AraC family transcriptional regulator of adaptative response/methylated-DNA-[protein]-cysteine methyltransferase